MASIPAIVTQEQFDRVQAKLAQNRQFASRNNTAQSYLLRGLVSCGVCGLACLGRCLQSQHRYYCCRGKLSALQSHRETKCRSRFIPAEPIESLVWEDLCHLLTHPEAISYALERAHGGHWLPQDLQARREVLQRGQTHVQQQIERLTEAYLSEVVGLEEYRRRRHDLEQKAQSLGAQRQQLEAQVDRQSEIARLSLSIDEFCRRVQEGLEQATWEQKRQLIEGLVVRVIVTDGEVEIRYAIPTSPNGEATRFCHLRSDYRAVDKILKSGCRAEETKLRTAERLVNLLRIYCILSWRDLLDDDVWNCVVPYWPPRLALTDLELDLLDELVRDKGQVLLRSKTLAYYLTKIAFTGPIHARGHDPPPRHRVMWRGLSRRMDIEFWR